MPDIFEAIGNLTAMRPVVVNPQISFAQLEQEMVSTQDAAARELVREQFLAKLQVKKRHLDAQATQDFETRAGMSPNAFIQKLRSPSVDEVAAWFVQNPNLGEVLDRKRQGNGQPVFVSDHPDALHHVERGYGNASKPEDYLKEFKDFITSHGNELPALVTVLTRPRDLTRKQLKELTLALDQAGFTETRLATAWRELSNQDIAARIMGYIRQAAIGDALLPYAERVDHALQNLLAKPAAGKPWTQPQRDWLKRIAAQTKANLLVDRDALDDPDLIFKLEGGGFARLDKLFNGQLQYKRSVGENVINQGLFYLDWLMDHKAEFKLLVLDKLGAAAADAIDWSAPRVVCIAADFTKYDGHAVQQIGRNIELIRYRRFGDDLLLLESANAGGDANSKAASSKQAKAAGGKLDSTATVLPDATAAKVTGPDKSYAELLAGLSEPMLQLLTSLEDYMFSLGDDVQRKELRVYAAFKRLKNFATVVLVKRNHLLLYLHVDPATALAVLPKARDVSKLGHWGTGNLEVPLSSMADLEAVKPFINAAYEGRAAVAKQAPYCP